MSKMVQVRNVPDELHARLRARAEGAGMSLSDYLLRELERVAGRPPLGDLLAAAASRSVPLSTRDITAALRTARQSR